MSNVYSGSACVLWMTGLPGSGKSTLASALAERLGSTRPVEWLDGDQMRKVIPGVGFERAERERYLAHVALLASTLERHGVTPICSFVSPYRSSRRFARELCRNFVEIHVATPLAECERRDPKGLYRKARTGELAHFTGVTDPYEPPEQAELTLDTTQADVGELLTRITNYLEQSSFLK